MITTHLYILCGLPFAGKTTLAKALVRELHLSRVSIDDLNTERGIWDDEKGLSSEEWTNVYNEAYRRLDALLSQGKSVLDDNANFTREQRDHLRVIAAKYQVPTTVIYVMTPLTEVRRRWQENRQTKVRNDVRDEDFALVVDSFEAPTDDEHVVCYDGVMTVEEWIRVEFIDERVAQMRQDFVQAQKDQCAELWYEGIHGESLAVLISGERGWLMYLQDSEDDGVHSYDNAYTGPQEAMLEFFLNNNQRDAYPVSWTLTINEVMKAVEYFLKTGKNAPWITWNDT